MMVMLRCIAERRTWRRMLVPVFAKDQDLTLGWFQEVKGDFE
jgi:hypothetical protein